MDIDKIHISKEGTHHIKDGKPIYDKRFENVQSFHEPGIAAVEDKKGAYHIDKDGKEIYEKRYKKTYGFYEGLAAVKDESGWYHIKTDGTELYSRRFDWVGNFQEGRCTVRVDSGYYFHIDKTGDPAYQKRYKYTGDYKYGVAVVYKENGMATHIDRDGNEVHGKEFVELDVFHKGHAVARDEDGFFHISREGEPLYSMRYEWIEPFYNGKAFARKYDGSLIVLDETTYKETPVRKKNNPYCEELAREEIKQKLVGFWDTQILHCIAKSDILDKIEDGNKTIEELKRALDMPEKSIDILLDVLKIWDMIMIDENELKITELGEMLTEDTEKSLKYPALMWGEEHYLVMSKMFDALKTHEPQFESMFGSPFFQYLKKHPEAIEKYNKALEVYASDYSELIKSLPLSDIETLMDVGGGSGYLLSEIIQHYDFLKKGILFDLPPVISHAKDIREEVPSDKIEFVEGDFFEDELPETEGVIMSRVIHDWDDEHAEKILNKINKSLSTGGRLFVLEMVVPETVKSDFGVTLNFDLLVTVGGRERTKKEFIKLIENTGFKMIEVISTDGIISALICEKVQEVEN